MTAATKNGVETRIKVLEERSLQTDKQLVAIADRLEKGFAELKASQATSRVTGSNVIALCAFVLALSTGIIRLGASGPLADLDRLREANLRVDAKLDERGRWIGGVDANINRNSDRIHDLRSSRLRIEDRLLALERGDK